MESALSAQYADSLRNRFSFTHANLLHGADSPIGENDTIEERESDMTTPEESEW